jgi:hypothetical protein
MFIGFVVKKRFIFNNSHNPFCGLIIPEIILKIFFMRFAVILLPFGKFHSPALK